MKKRILLIFIAIIVSVQILEFSLFTNIDKMVLVTFIVINTIISLAFLIFLIKVMKDAKEYKTNISKVTNHSMATSTIPFLVVYSNGKIFWKNTNFDKLFRNENISKEINNLIEEIKLDVEEKENKLENSEEDLKKHITIAGRDYYVLIQQFFPKGSKYTKEEYFLTLTFLDQTKYNWLKKEKEDEKLCFILIKVDNFEILESKLSAVEKPRIYADIERKIYSWIESNGGLMLKPDADEYVGIFKKRALKNIVKDKFSILDIVKETEDTLIPITLSIAGNTEGETLEKIYQEAVSLIEIVRGRGGDQAVVKDAKEVKIFGGQSKEIEKTEKVKARMVSSVLADMIRKSPNVVIMGHQNIDLDALGSACGMYKFAKKYNNNVHILTKLDSLGLGRFKEDILKEESIKENVLSKFKVDRLVNQDTLVIVVDVHRKNFVEFPEVLEKTKKIVVIDHHRKLLDSIESTLEYHEVYASSASELVTELIQYSPKKIELSKFDADILYAGIYLDTKGLTVKTGVKTFEASAYLRKHGVDIAEIKKVFETDLDEYKEISRIISTGKLIESKIVVAKDEKISSNAQLICAKTADELINLKNIKASIVFGSNGKETFISLRSNSEINVQIIAEDLGGGGHMNLAGAQFKTNNLEEVEKEIENAVKRYFKNVHM